MNVTVIGTGYVGLTTGTILSDIGHSVTCIDINEEKIGNLKKGILPIYEPGLDEVVVKNFEAGNLHFSTHLEDSLSESDVVFIAVQTPQDEDGSADLQYVEAVAREIGEKLELVPEAERTDKVIVNKSTVPVGTGDIVQSIIGKLYSGKFDVVSNPEFLREGQAVHDSYHPDRIVVGMDCYCEDTHEKMEKLYEPLNAEMLVTDLKSAELIKYASNSFLALSISFINSIANLVEKVGGDVEMVSRGMKLDKRIGPHAFLSAGSGYGGSCFPKDVQALINIADTAGYDFDILKAAERVNYDQKHVLAKKVEKILGGDVSGKKIALWGLSFKPETDDMREAISIVAINDLKKSGAEIVAYDPVAIDEAKRLELDVDYANSPLEAAKDADALLVVTEWKQFKEVELGELKKALKENNIVDGRNIFDPESVRRLGFVYEGIGRP